MEGLSHTVKVAVRQTPLLFSSRYRYQLSDFSYGEWLVLENNQPRYYLNILDELYDNVRGKVIGDVDEYLSACFKKKQLPLSIGRTTCGIPVTSKSRIIELTLEKLPLTCFC